MSVDIGPVDRRTFLGGSDIAAVLGISPWQTPYQLWLEKTATGPVELDAKKEAFFRRRKMLEPYVIELAKVEHELDVVAKNERYFDSSIPHFSCEVDFEHAYEGSIENADVKTANAFASKEWGEPGSDEIPQHYTAQFLWGQMITGRQSTLCMAMIGLDRLVPYRVIRSEAVISWMRGQAEQFWEMVEAKKAPEITTLEDARLAFQRERQAKQVIASKEVLEMVSRLELRKKAMAGDQAKLDLLELDIRKFMGDAEELVSPEGERLATWKTQKRKAYSVMAGESRVLRIA